MLRANNLRMEGRVNDAVSVLTDSIESEGDSPMSVEVAQATRAVAALLEDDDRWEEANAGRQELVRRFGDADEPAVREIVDETLRRIIRRLRRDKRYAEALNAREALLRRLDEQPPKGRPCAALDALLGKAWDLGSLGRREDELAAYDELLRRAHGASDPEVVQRVGMALADKAATLLDLARYGEVIDVADQMPRRLAVAGDADFRAELSRGLQTKADALVALGRWQAAIDVIEAGERQLAGATAPNLRLRAASLMGLRGYCLLRLGESDGALAAWCELVRCYAEDPASGWQELVVATLAQAIGLLLASGRITDATAVNDTLLARLQTSNHPKLDPLYAPALLAKATGLADEGRCEVAIELIDEVLAHVEKSDSADAPAQAALAMSAKIMALEQLNRKNDAQRLRRTLAQVLGPVALITFDEIADSLKQQSSTDARERRAAALANKASILSGEGREREAKVVFRELVESYEADESEVIQRLVDLARGGLR